MDRIQEKIALLQANPTLCMLYSFLCEYGDRVAARYTAHGKACQETYAELAERTTACAQALRSILGTEGGWVGLAVETGPDWPVLFWGLLMAGFNPLLLDASAEDAQIAHLVRQSQARAVITRVERPLPAQVLQLSPDALAHNVLQTPFTPTWADAAALCTSGTTASSRIFVYEGRALAAQIIGAPGLTGMHPGIFTEAPLRSLCFLPMHHVFGFVLNVLLPSFLGYEQVYLENRAPQTIVETCRKYRVQLIATVPLLVHSLASMVEKRMGQAKPLKRTAYRALKSVSLGIQAIAPRAGLGLARRTYFASAMKELLGPDLACIVVGGSHAVAAHLRTINALGYEVCVGYGMTEVAIVSVETSSKLPHRLGGGIGKPSNMIDMKIVPETGELLIRSTAMHTGRLVNGLLLPADVDAEGYYHTGDIAHLGQNGRLHLDGRCKEIILTANGENVYPDEIEDAFGELENVLQSCVLGLGSDTKQEAALVLAVGPRYVDSALQNTIANEIVRRNLRLAPGKRITAAYLAEGPLPLANGIKVKRQALRKLCEEQLLDLRALDLKTARLVEKPGKAVREAVSTKDAEWTRIHDQVRLAFAQVLSMDTERIGDTDHFIDDLGGDSLQSLGIALKLEEQFQIEIPQEAYFQCVNVAEVTALLHAHLHGSSKEAPARVQVKPITRYEDSAEYQAFQARFAAMEGQRNPYFVCHDSALSDVSKMDGREVLNFGSYNYVGMSGRPEVMAAAKAAIDQYGTSASGSRLLAGEKQLYQELEREIAAWKRTEDALVLVGGHSTNVTFVGNFCGPNDLILYDALSHNSIDQGCRLSPATARAFPHNDVEALARMLAQYRHRYEKVLIAVEGAYSMDGDIAPVPAFVRLKKQYGCFLLVDEAHSACVIGETGGGVDEYFHLAPDDVDIKMGTLSKGLGACGGYLAASHAIIETMRYGLPGFVFSVGISPPVAAAALEAVRLLQREPEIVTRLHHNVRTFLAEAHLRGLNTCLALDTAIVPILVGREEDAFRLSTLLADKGVFVPPAVYPAVPRGKARLRFCVISEHRKEQIIQALDQLMDAAREAGVDLPEMDASRQETA